MNTQVLMKKAEDMKKKSKKNKKGFTLVELIVVLVIIAILAAVLVPTMSGYIGKAKKTATQSAAKTVLTAANSIGQEAISNTDAIKLGAAGTAENSGEIYKADAWTALDVASSETSKIKSMIIDKTTGAVIYMYYEDTKYYAEYTYSGGKSVYNTGKNPSSPSYKGVNDLTTSDVPTAYVSGSSVDTTNLIQVWNSNGVVTA